MSQQALAQVLRDLPQRDDPDLLVGSATSDDAGVYRLAATPALSLVQTVDFFTPIVDDAYLYGQIAAANSLSDVYAMGGRPLTAMAVAGMPVEQVPPPVIREIFRGGAEKVVEAECSLVGGHTIQNPEPIYGLSVTGLVDTDKLITNAGARAGDRLVLTKPLGTGIITTGIKRGTASAAAADVAVASMALLNTPGAELGAAGLVQAATDVTGFGLLGHLTSLCQASGVGARLEASALPVLADEVWDLINQGCVPGGTKGNLAAAGPTTVFDDDVPEATRLLLADAQTSGGLLLCVPPDNLDAVLDVLKRCRTPAAAIIGAMVERGEDEGALVAVSK